jgi:hypothetical protein
MLNSLPTFPRIPFLFLLLGLISICRTHAQAPPQIGHLVTHLTSNRFLIPEYAPPSYLLADDVSLRKCPGTSCEVLAQLPIGSALILLEESTDTIIINGIRSPWYKTKFGGQTGWVWGGMIAQFAFGSQTDPSVKFVAGYEKMVYEDERWRRYMQVRAFRKGEQLDKISVRCPAWEFDWVKNLGPCGLKNLSDIIDVGVACSGGCGCRGGDLLWAWTGSKFILMDEQMGTSDGEFSDGSHFIYPTDMEGIPGTLIKVVRSVNDTEVLRAKNKLEQIQTLEFYYWAGEKLVRSGRPSVVKKTLMDYDFHH